MTHLDFDLSTLAERIAESPDVDLVREMVTFLYQALIDVEAVRVHPDMSLRVRADV